MRKKIEIFSLNWTYSFLQLIPVQNFHRLECRWYCNLAGWCSLPAIFHFSNCAFLAIPLLMLKQYTICKVVDSVFFLSAVVSSDSSQITRKLLFSKHTQCFLWWDVSRHKWQHSLICLAIVLVSGRLSPWFLHVFIKADHQVQFPSCC